MDVLLPGVDVTSLVRARVDPGPVIALAEVAATLATMLGPREVMLLTAGEWSDATVQPGQLPGPDVINGFG